MFPGFANGSMKPDNPRETNQTYRGVLRLKKSMKNGQSITNQPRNTKTPVQESSNSIQRDGSSYGRFPSLEEMRTSQSSVGPEDGLPLQPGQDGG
jgi:hypothetical protein